MQNAGLFPLASPGFLPENCLRRLPRLLPENCCPGPLSQGQECLSSALPPQEVLPPWVPPGEHPSPQGLSLWKMSPQGLPPEPSLWKWSPGALQVCPTQGLPAACPSVRAAPPVRILPPWAYSPGHSPWDPPHRQEGHPPPSPGQSPDVFPGHCPPGR